MNYAASTETLVNAAKRLVDELPEGTSPQDVIKHWLASARADDAARGVIWPTITSGEDGGSRALPGSIFPNMSILQGVTFALCYRARPYGDDPNKCIFESLCAGALPGRRGAEDRVGLRRADRGEVGLGAGAGLLEHERGAEGHEVARLPRHRCPIRTRSRRSPTSTATWPTTWARARPVDQQVDRPDSQDSRVDDSRVDTGRCVCRKGGTSPGIGETSCDKNRVRFDHGRKSL